MSELAEFDGTSVCAPVLVSKPDTTIRYGGILDEQGTSSGLVWTVYLRREPAHVRRVVALPAAATALAELRRLTGFTWDQVARALDVTPRTPFLWTQGNPVSRANEERLQRVVALIRRVDRGSADANRAALLGARSDGTVPFDLLVAGELERAEAALSMRTSPVSVPEQTLRDRRPMSPVDRMSLSDEKIHTDAGVVRTARSVRVKKGD
jgi:pimeloyl-ACP methyl ester carboxylesterase